MISIIASFLVGTAVAHATPFIWRNVIMVGPADVLSTALGLKSAPDIQSFREMLRQKQVDPREYLGSLISMIPEFAAQQEFARRFDVEDPVFGTPEQMRLLSPTFKHVLMRLAMKRMSRVDLERVRTRAADFENIKIEQVIIFFHHAEGSLTVDEFFSAWDEFKSTSIFKASCDGLVTQA